jgi:hypothetical protein
LRESPSAARGSQKNFSKALDDAAKADQNPASLLKKLNAKADSWRQRKRVEKYGEKKFSKVLDDKQNGRLNSRLFAADG